MRYGLLSNNVPKLAAKIGTYWLLLAKFQKKWSDKIIFSVLLLFKMGFTDFFELNSLTIYAINTRIVEFLFALISSFILLKTLLY
jgi:hypothetical protein